MSGGTIHSGGQLPINTTPIRLNDQQVARLTNTENIQSLSAEQKANVKQISTQLNNLLERVAKRSTAMVDLSSLRSAFATANSKTFTKALAAAELAQSALEALNGLSAKDIAASYKKSFFGGEDWRGPVGTQVKTAMKAQSDLSEALLKLCSDPGLDADIHELITEKYLQSCCRESELSSTLMSILDLHKAAPDQRTPEESASLDKTLKDWMHHMSKVGHGTASTFEKTLADISNILMYLQGDDANLGANAHNTMRLTLEKAQIKIQNALSTASDPTFFKEALNILDQIKGALNNLHQTVSTNIVDRHIKTFFSPALTFSQPLMAALQKNFPPNLKKLLTTQEQLGQALKNLSIEKQRQPQNPQLIHTLNQGISSYIDDLKIFIMGDKQKHLVAFAKELDNLVNLLRKPDLANAPYVDKSLFEKVNADDALKNEILQFAKDTTFANIIKECISKATNANVHANAFVSFVDRCMNFSQTDINTKHVLRAIFEEETKGTDPLSTIVECRANGLKDADIDPSLCDKNVVQSKAFGQGGINTVYEVKMKNGHSYIFKPECSNRIGLNNLLTARGGYDTNVNLSALNIASHDIAQLLNGESNVVNARVGIFNGQVGLFMEKARGCEIDAYVNIHNPSHNQPRLNSLNDRDFLRVNGQIMQKCYNLEWTDFILGSSDRHRGNYFINIDQKGDVSLKGIDNDMTFGKYRTSFTTISYNSAETSNFLKKYTDAAQSVTRKALPPNFLKDELLKNGITLSGQGTNLSMTVDLSKIKEPWVINLVQNTKGLHNFTPPKFIDATFYNNLMKFDNPQAKAGFRARLKGRMNNANIEAAMLRLNTAIAYAKDLHAKGRVVTNWQSAQAQKFVLNVNEQAIEKNHSTDAFNAGLNDRAGNAHMYLRNLYFRDFYHVAAQRIRNL